MEDVAAAARSLSAAEVAVTAKRASVPSGSRADHRPAAPGVKDPTPPGSGSVTASSSTAAPSASVSRRTPAAGSTGSTGSASASLGAGPLRSVSATPPGALVGATPARAARRARARLSTSTGKAGEASTVERAASRFTRTVTAPPTGPAAEGSPSTVTSGVAPAVASGRPGRSAAVPAVHTRPPSDQPSASGEASSSRKGPR